MLLPLGKGLLENLWCDISLKEGRKTAVCPWEAGERSKDGRKQFIREGDENIFSHPKQPKRSCLKDLLFKFS